jgi:hypothetical protein
VVGDPEAEEVGVIDGDLVAGEEGQIARVPVGGEGAALEDDTGAAGSDRPGADIDRRKGSGGGPGSIVRHGDGAAAGREAERCQTGKEWCGR